MRLDKLETGPKADVFLFVRDTERCPAREFLDNCEDRMKKRFRGSFFAATREGDAYHNEQRFKPLKGDGKPLWEFKEHDHRIYCYRRRINGIGEKMEFILLCGWVKDKKRGREEDREIQSAKRLLDELLRSEAR